MARKGSRKRWNKRGGEEPAVTKVGTDMFEGLGAKATGAIDAAESRLSGFHTMGTGFVDKNLGAAKGFLSAQANKITSAADALKGAPAAPAAPEAPEAATGGRRRRSRKNKKRSRTTKRKRVRFSKKRSFRRSRSTKRK
jgi:hypothetical protein